jgi:hypothetical protein
MGQIVIVPALAGRLRGFDDFTTFAILDVSIAKNYVSTVPMARTKHAFTQIGWERWILWADPHVPCVFVISDGDHITR